MVDPVPADERIEQIRRAAVDVFAANGFRGTSMAAIAEAVGISRPALYQYFENRQDVFRAAMQRTLDEAANAAVASLEQSTDPAEALAGWLRRSHLDGYAGLYGLAHAQELLEAHHEFSQDVADAAAARRQAALESWLRGRPDPVEPDVVEAALELLLLAPGGLKADHPTPQVYGRRLDRLAEAVAARIAAGPST